MEKRLEKRIKKNLKVILGDCGYETFTTTFNISRKGLSVLSEEKLPANCEVLMMVATPDDLIYMTGKVKWSDDIYAEDDKKYSEPFRYEDTYILLSKFLRDSGDSKGVLTTLETALERNSNDLWLINLIAMEYADQDINIEKGINPSANIITKTMWGPDSGIIPTRAEMINTHPILDLIHGSMFHVFKPIFTKSSAKNVQKNTRQICF